MNTDPDKTQELPVTAPDHKHNWTPPAPVAVARGVGPAPRSERQPRAKTAHPLTRPLAKLNAEKLPKRDDQAEDARVERWFGAGMGLVLVLALVLIFLKSDFAGVL